ncbi:hypothetical protein CK203_103561 [Vitis vinifera]|uniref:Uncharacterized protein n=1 Tax=Vitis vinifera TaxID=29760 RepID=A0A438EME1_VITVI|nr:hypothetical protein CK203_103561 [Vitis vinifera]
MWKATLRSVTNVKDMLLYLEYPLSALIRIKKRLEREKGKWVDELIGVLWAYRITSRKPTGANPFALAYGMEAIILTEVGMPRARTAVWEAENDNSDLERHLDGQMENGK